MFFWIFTIIWAILLLPLGYYYESNSNVAAPQGLQNIYDIEIFSWEWTLIIFSTLSAFIFGYIIIWIGFQEMNTGPIKTLEEDDNRRRVVKDFDHTKFMENLRKQIYGDNYNYKKLKKD